MKIAIQPVSIFPGKTAVTFSVDDVIVILNKGGTARWRLLDANDTPVAAGVLPLTDATYDTWATDDTCVFTFAMSALSLIANGEAHP